MIISEITCNGLHFVVDTDHEGRARLIHFSTKPFDKENIDIYAYRPLLELHLLGYDTNFHHGSLHLFTSGKYLLLNFSCLSDFCLAAPVSVGTSANVESLILYTSAFLMSIC